LTKLDFFCARDIIIYKSQYAITIQSVCILIYVSHLASASLLWKLPVIQLHRTVEIVAKTGSSTFVFRDPRTAVASPCSVQAERVSSMDFRVARHYWRVRVLWVAWKRWWFERLRDVQIFVCNNGWLLFRPQTLLVVILCTGWRKKNNGQLVAASQIFHKIVQRRL